MHGPTCMSYRRVSDALDRLWGLKRSNGGLYRVIDEFSGRVIASLDTYALYWPLCGDENEKRRKENAA